MTEILRDEFRVQQVLGQINYFSFLANGIKKAMRVLIDLTVLMIRGALFILDTYCGAFLLRFET